MTTGTIASIRDRGFGFIARDGEGGGADLFFHSSAVGGDGFDALRQGQRVSFDEEPDPRDPTRRRAVNVQPAGGGDDQ
jgi:CspA family cold shock protein